MGGLKLEAYGRAGEAGQQLEPAQRLRTGSGRISAVARDIGAHRLDIGGSRRSLRRRSGKREAGQKHGDLLQ